MATVGTRLLTIKVDSVEYKAQVTNVRISAADAESSDVTFDEAAQGGAREYTLNMTILQDMATGTLWREVWDNAGDTVPFIIAGYGNTTASAGEPHISGNAVITEPDGDLFGGQADRATTGRWSIEVSWPCTAKPALVTS